MSASDVRALADSLTALDDETLAGLFLVRQVPAAAGWDDLLDAAESLLDPASLDLGYAALTRADADALTDALTPAPRGTVPSGPPRDALRRAGLIGDDGVPFDAVRTHRPVAITSAGAASPGAPATDAELAERAFHAAASLADIIDVATRTPLARIGTGALGATDRRRLVDIGAADDADAADELLAIAEIAGLIAPDARRWLVTEASIPWLHDGTIERWGHVARRLGDALPRGLAEGTGWVGLDTWPGAYPFDPQWPHRAGELAALFRRWGMIGADGFPPAWGAALAAGGDVDADALQRLLPGEVDKVFLQNDLTAIAPGPLRPHLELRLRSMARRESRAQASTYRFGADTIGQALTGGETAASIREFLQELSLTGLPQPLAYEIDRTADRHGAVRVGPDGTGATRICGDDAALVSALAVDQSLRPLALTRTGDALVTHTPPESVYWMLVDARYPVVAVDGDGRPHRLDRVTVVPEPPTPTPISKYGSLLARLRSAQPHDTDAAWRMRELERAARTRETLTVTVRFPDGAERDVAVEVLGVGGGRLRGRDANSDVERTLPISHIVSIRHPEASAPTNT
ncbi:helicase-associated domain-containing protein [Microbacterium sp.]|uniref:helicase-associated domain-containing protein n=1 Tax=Microbacterium sp. TaxID=51671 RepID=UPI003A8C3C1B